MPCLWSSRILVVQSSIAASAKTSRPSILLPWAVLRMEDYFIARSGGPPDRENHNIVKGRQIHFILRHRMISMQVREQKSLSTSRTISARSETPSNSTRSLPNPQFLFKLSKSCQNVLDLLVREERALASERSQVSQHVFVVWDAIFV